MPYPTTLLMQLMRTACDSQSIISSFCLGIISFGRLRGPCCLYCHTWQKAWNIALDACVVVGSAPCFGYFFSEATDRGVGLHMLFRK